MRWTPPRDGLGRIHRRPHFDQQLILPLANGVSLCCARDDLKKVQRTGSLYDVEGLFCGMVLGSLERPRQDSHLLYYHLVALFRLSASSPSLLEDFVV